MKWYNWLAIIPFLGFLGGLGFANRMEPFVLGLPFLPFWIVLWVVLSSLILSVIYTFHYAKEEEGNQ